MPDIQYGNDAGADIDAWLRLYRQLTGTPGLSVAIVDREGIARQFQCGLRSLETGMAVTGNDLFQAGSISKTLTAVSVLRASEQGLLDLQSTVSSWVPEFKRLTPWQGATVADLLSHRSGLPMGMNPGPDSFSELASLVDFPATLRPGERLSYSNFGYDLLGLILERAHDQAYAAILADGVLAACGMTDTLPSIAAATRARTVPGYTWQYDDRPHRKGDRRFEAPWRPSRAASENIVSTASDIGRLLSAILRRDSALLSPAGFDAMCAPQAHDGEQRYGYGLFLYENNGRAQFGHPGSMPGFRNMMLADPEQGIGVVILSNLGGSDHTIAIQRLAGQVLACLTGPRTAPCVIRLQARANLAALAGTYHPTRAGDATLHVVVGNQDLEVWINGEAIALQRREHGRFYAADPRFGRHHFAFDENALSYGARLFVRTPEAAPPAPHPAQACIGKYRSHHALIPCVEVVDLHGSLHIIANDVIAPLLATGRGGCYRVADGPEHVEFAGADGCTPVPMLSISRYPYYRVHAPGPQGQVHCPYRHFGKNSA